MSEHVSSTPDQGDRALERELSELRRFVAFPPTPDLATAVRTRLVARPRRDRIHVPELFARRPWLVAAAAVLVLALAATIASGSVRHAIADALGVPGIRIEFGDDDPTVPLSLPGSNLGLGERASLDEAISTVDFPIQIPDSGIYGAPDAVFVRNLRSGGTLVTLIYSPDDTLPEAAETKTGALLMQFRSTENVDIMLKGVRGDGSIREVAFGGGRGFWIQGTSSLTILDDPSATTCCTSRPSANVLLWQRGGVTYRLESALTFEEAKTIIESMTPVSTVTPATTREP
jgi:hypothetical protein